MVRPVKSKGSALPTSYILMSSSVFIHSSHMLLEKELMNGMNTCCTYESLDTKQSGSRYIWTDLPTLRAPIKIANDALLQKEILSKRKARIGSKDGVRMWKLQVTDMSGTRKERGAYCTAIFRLSANLFPKHGPRRHSGGPHTAKCSTINNLGFSYWFCPK